MSIITNFFPIEIPFSSFQIHRVAYSKEALDRFRNLYNKTHSFFRTDDYIYISQMVDSSPQLGEKVLLDVNNNTRVVSSLIKHIFFRTFRDNYKEVIPQSFYPFRIFSRKQEDDLVHALLPLELKNVLSFKKLIEIQFREVQIAQQIKFGAVINIRYRWLFDMNCKKLLEQGYTLVGQQVLTSEPLLGLEGVLAPDESLIGTITNIQGDQAVVETNDGRENHNLQDLFLHKSMNNIREFLEFKVGKAKASQIINHISDKDQSRLDAKYYYGEIAKMAQNLANKKYTNEEGFSYSISSHPQPIAGRFTLHAPSFIFDYNPGATHTNPSVGLNNFGPYDSSTFDQKHLFILVVCHKSNRGGFAEFLGKLKSGIASSSYFKGGMVGKYKLHDISFEILELDDLSIYGYKKKITEYIETCNSLPNLAIVETLDSFRRQQTENNPYFQIKAYFLTLGIPVQFIKNENIRKQDRDLQWICESVALQIYAKLGGKPWVLPASSSIDHEIVVGIGSTLLRPNLLTGNIQERIVGITTFFTGDGRYILGNRCKEVTYDAYFNELLSSLRQSIETISKEYGWVENATIRITFHIFKPIKNIEADVVEQLIQEFKQFEIQHCFVTVSENHPFLMFDDNQHGIGSNHKGRYVPNRETNWILDQSSCLLQLTGSQNIKTVKHRFSNPILIRIHEKSTFNDLNTVTQQILNFTFLSWRSFHPVQQPVTILYSDLIATQLSQLRKINSWKPEIVNSLLKFKKWFL